MAKTTIDTWEPQFFEQSSLFNSVREVSRPFSQLPQWPTLAQFASEFKKRKIQSYANQPVHPVAQAGAPETFEDHYESRIYLKGELQTRLENWHDFFNALCWLQFPNIKSALNALHFEASKTRKLGTNRSPLENALTLFDECGAVIVADEDALLERVRQHEWKALFYETAHWDKNLFRNNKASSGQHIRCYVVGHAMYEKALTPYLGMTAHSVLLNRGSDFFQQPYAGQLAEIDRLVADCWINRKIQQPKDLQPFPLLGVPGWWRQAQDEAFYANEEYFRSKSRQSMRTE
jgi:hypothetical protein